jgi:hypothetical protein
MARLVVQFGDKTQEIVNLELPTVTTGFESTAHIALDDPLVTPEHRRVRLMGGGRYTLARSSMDHTLRCLLGEDERGRFAERHRPSARSSRPMEA